jgi:hypothetical protein
MLSFIVKWVEMYDIFNYYPCIKIFSEYHEARNYQIEKEEEFDGQENKMEELYDGKIISEIYLEEVKL